MFFFFLNLQPFILVEALDILQWFTNSYNNFSIWSDVTVFLSKKYDGKLLSFLSCSEYGTFTSVSFFELFTKNKRQNITIIRLHIDIFHSIIMKHSNTYDILEKILRFLELRKPMQVHFLINTCK